MLRHPGSRLKRVGRLTPFAARGPMAATAMSPSTESRSRVVICRGAQATERRLLDEIERAAAMDMQSLQLPVRVVVPSGSLRRHVLRALVRRHSGPAIWLVEQDCRPVRRTWKTDLKRDTPLV